MPPLPDLICFEQWYPLEGPRGAALENDQGQPSMLRLRIEYLPGQEHAGTHGESKQDWLSSNAESSSNSTTQAAAEPTFPPSGEAPSAPSDGEKDAATEGDGSITRSREHSEEDTKSGHVM